ncbi:MAG: YqgE/AlgH family protein [Lacibacter sp.]
MIEPATGVLLVSDPFLKDPNFMRTVVLLCEHKEEGSFGLVLNRAFELSLDQLMNQSYNWKTPVYIGGPVQMDTLHFLHQLPDIIPGGIEICKGVFWGGDFETVTTLLNNNLLDFNKIRFYIGYSGWSAGQLTDEMKEKSWLTVPANRNLIFTKKVENIWKDAVKSMGKKYEQVIHYPIDPQLN